MWRCLDEMADALWSADDGCRASPSGWGARCRCRRCEYRIVVGCCWSCRLTCSTAGGPSGGGISQQRHSRSDDDRQTAGKRRAR
ncbi:hypothetical protein HMPREF1549_03133 [Actinomyces johnsonii F0510]|uniref:Uncharacterized protein n=1 Tax=Actinomyces johnsonii F0510 TaxID=1227262 RepID=U1Q036_9ACTO|nr:hypothetical protein HMPREF1549_03133 [Actinomyces johnsonii F0510]